MSKKKPARKPINASTKKLYRIKQRTPSTHTDSLLKFTGEGKEHVIISSKSASMAAWAMGRVNSFIRGGHSQDNDIKKGSRVKKKVKYRKAYLPSILRIKKNSKSSVAKEIKATAKAYKQGRYIDLKKVQKE